MDNKTHIPSKDLIRKQYESYSHYFTEIIANIISILQPKVSLQAQPTYKSRVKSFNSYYKKILRLKPEEASASDSLICLTDMMGIRMICAFLEDINLGLEQIKKIFEIKEVEVKGAEKKFSEFGYESVHVLIAIPEECKPALEGEYKALKPLPETAVCEIQIRTILQDAWAEVEHELIYKTEFNPFDIPLRRKLASLNASLTLADITFQEIRDYQNKLQKEIEDRRQSFYSLADNLLNEKPKKTEKKENVNRITPFVQGTIDDMLLQAIHAHNEGNLEEAVNVYSQILDAISPEEKNVIAVIRKHRGMAYFSMNKFSDALEDFKISIEKDPKAFRTYYYAGIVYSIQKEYEKAVECFNKSLEINKFQAHTYFRRAKDYYELKEYEKSMDDLNSALNLGMDEEECKPLQEKLVKKFGLNM
jgi:ppGpp synthetase/RelA/SpoT-type nucleotidyltranferase/predicted negative regulator of RcsB-dependent stress response